jgi:hypothetical protein
MFKNTAVFNGETFYRDSKTKTYSHAVIVIDERGAGTFGWSSTEKLAINLAKYARNSAGYTDVHIVPVTLEA